MVPENFPQGDVSMDTHIPLQSQPTYPLPTGFDFADPPIVRRVQLRDAAILDIFLTGDDHAMQWGIDATVSADFDREQIVKVINVDSVVFRSKTYASDGHSDMRHTLGPDAKAFWMNTAQIYADNMSQHELDWLRDKVRKQVILTGNGG
jgi:uncharacterized protein YfdQ (DUF2303 family)